MRRFFLLPFILLLFIGCNQSGNGIFYTISDEKPLEDSDTLPNTLSVSGMVEGDQKYFISAAGLYSRDKTTQIDAPWNDAVSMPPGGMTICVQLLEFGGKMYGLFSNAAGDVTKLYSSPLSGVQWTERGSFSQLIVSIAAGVSEMFVTLRSDVTVYDTRVSSDGLDFSTSLSLSGQYTAVTDAATLGADTWLISGNNLYSGSGTAYALVTAAGAPSTTSGFGGIYVTNNLAPVALFVSNHEGVVYSSADGITWYNRPVTDTEGNPIDVVLFDISEISVLTADVIVIGAENGYYEIIFDSGYTTPFNIHVPGSDEAGSYSSSDSNFGNIDLRTSVIRFFFLDASSNTLFACTSGNGLWINRISGTTVATLTRKWDRQ